VFFTLQISSIKGRKERNSYIGIIRKQYAGGGSITIFKGKDDDIAKRS
jgi:hypothetical protein